MEPGESPQLFSTQKKTGHLSLVFARGRGSVGSNGDFDIMGMNLCTF